jgi:hypothetical protein
VIDKVIDSIAVIESHEQWRAVIEKAVITDANFTHLARFTKKYHSELMRRRAQLAKSQEGGH